MLATSHLDVNYGAPILYEAAMEAVAARCLFSRVVDLQKRILQSAPQFFPKSVDLFFDTLTTMQEAVGILEREHYTWMKHRHQTWCNNIFFLVEVTLYGKQSYTDRRKWIPLPYCNTKCWNENH